MNIRALTLMRVKRGAPPFLTLRLSGSNDFLDRLNGCQPEKEQFNSKNLTGQEGGYPAGRPLALTSGSPQVSEACSLGLVSTATRLRHSFGSKVLEDANPLALITRFASQK